MGQVPVTGSSEPLVSVVVPANNEATTVPAFVEKTAKAFADLGRPWELVYVDDGSSDGTAAAVEAEAAREPRVRLVRQRRRLGLTEALNRGFREARGDIIVFLPADLESDPEVDVPLLLGKLDQGYDLNWIKAFRREVTDGLALRSQWHRYILVMAHHEGYRIGEVKVPYRPRAAGRSKFGLGRLPVSAIDVVTLKFLLTFQRKPIIFFGGLGSALIGAGLLVWAYLGWLFLATQTQRRPLMLAGGIAILSGLLIVLVGFLGELVVNVSERVERLKRRLHRDPDPGP